METFKMMDESRKLVISVNGQLYFEEICNNDGLFDKFAADWLTDRDFRFMVQPINDEMYPPKSFETEIPSREEMIKIIKDLNEYSVNDIDGNVYKIERIPSYIIVAYQNSHGEMVFG